MGSKEVADKIVDMISRTEYTSRGASDVFKQVVYGATHLRNWKIDMLGIVNSDGSVSMSWEEVRDEIIKVLDIGLESAQILRKVAGGEIPINEGKGNQIMDNFNREFYENQADSKVGKINESSKLSEDQRDAVT